jgi:hypothetical protein
MSQTDASRNSTTPVQTGRRRLSKAAVIARIVLPTAVGIVGFCLIQSRDMAYNRRIDAIFRGEVKPETLRVLQIAKDGESGWSVSLGKAGTTVARRSSGKVDHLRVGAAVDAYRFDEEYVIPRFDFRLSGSSGIKWTFLAAGVLPLLFAALRLLQTRMRRSAGERNEVCAAEGSAVRPPVFSQSHMRFDRLPDDSQLTCLLGGLDHGFVRTVEESGMLIARPWMIPLWFVTLFIVLVFAGITIMVVFTIRDLDSIVWLALASGWFVGLPAFLGIAAVLHHSFAKKGDYFRVNLALRTLELCRAGRTFTASEIISITLLTRWVCLPGCEWGMAHQTGVLVRTRDNRVELYPLVHDVGEHMSPSRRAKWADRLAAIFRVPVRRIELNKAASRALNDC